jgi:hypothetical protein
MVRISKPDKRFACLKTKTLAEADIKERYDLQEYIFNSREDFCKELGQDLTIIGKEVPPSDVVSDRIDLLAIDNEGDVVIIELKRGSDKLQLLQAISYAGMIAKWSPDQLLSRAEKDLGKDAATAIVDPDLVLNQGQRILLVAEAFDYEVLVGAEWLYSRGVEIDCVRVSLAVDGLAEYLTFAQVFPTPELADQARKRGMRTLREPLYSSWNEALSASTNETAVKFFRERLAVGCENNLRDRRIVVTAGAHKFRVRLRGDRARATQVGRFADDIAFWSERLSQPDTIYAGEKAGKEYALRFYLQAPEDFAAFQTALGELNNAQWDDSPVKAASA